MRKSYVMNTLFFGLFLMISLFSFDMEAQAKSWGETPSVNVEAIHERNASDFRNDSLSDENLIDNAIHSDLKAERKEWGASKENLEEAPVTSQKTSVGEDTDLEESSGKERDVRSKEEQEAIDDDIMANLLKEDNRQIDSEKGWSYANQVKQVFLDLQERNNLDKSWIKDTFIKPWMDSSVDWTTSLRDKIQESLKESWETSFDSMEKRLDSARRSKEEKEQRNHQSEDRWFIFDAKNQEESKEKESKKKKVKQEQTRNGKDLETKNKVYVNALIRVRMELVYFACAKEREWIVRRETLF